MSSRHRLPTFFSCRSHLSTVFLSYFPSRGAPRPIGIIDSSLISLLDTFAVCTAPLVYFAFVRPNIVTPAIRFDQLFSHNCSFCFPQLFSTFWPYMYAGVILSTFLVNVLQHASHCSLHSASGHFHHLAPFCTSLPLISHPCTMLHQRRQKRLFCLRAFPSSWLDVDVFSMRTYPQHTRHLQAPPQSLFLHGHLQLLIASCNSLFSTFSSFRLLSASGTPT